MKSKNFFFICTVAALLTVASCTTKHISPNGVDLDEQQLYIGENIAVAQTQYGKVRGYILRDIYTFYGIPYGASTAGENRFMPPQKPEPWSDVRPAVFYGNSAPQVVTYGREAESVSAFVDHWNYDLYSEDCLRLNVWTPQLDTKKRPVLVWLHGGGFSNGNSVEQDGYNGENLSRYGDIVFVSVNHRLNSFGYTDFAAVGGEKYKHSGNVGMLDIIASLEWIRDNISNFGGDPDNVTIMGQSGGGAKVSILASMPAAKGLVHKAVALSGNSIRGADKEYAEGLGAYIVEKAGLKPGEIDKLQQMPWEEYFALANAAAREYGQTHKSPNGRAGFSPVADGIDLPSGQFYDPSDPSIPDIPMLYCTTFEEGNPDRDRPALENSTIEDVIKALTPNYGEKAKAVVEAYAATFPDLRPIEVWGLLTGVRTNVVRSANVKVEQKSPVYMAWFGWHSPLFDGRLRAFHCSDISFWFHNTDYMLTHNGGGKRPRALSEKMSDALLAFMRTGNPNCKSLPEWPEYTPENGEVMILNDVCEVKNDPDRACRAVITGN